MKKIFRRQPVFLHFFLVLKNKKPKLFYLFLSFFILQLALTFVKLEVTPFLLYGMFSEKTPDTGNYAQALIFLDSTNIDSCKIPPTELMLLNVSIDNYLIMKRNGDKDIVQSRVESRYPFFTNSFVYPLVKDKIYNKPEDLKKFELWFKEKCANQIHRKVQKVSVVQKKFQLNRKQVSFKTISSDTIASF